MCATKEKVDHQTGSSVEAQWWIERFLRVHFPATTYSLTPVSALSCQVTPDLETHMKQCADSGKVETANQGWRAVAVPFKHWSDKRKHPCEYLRPSSSSLTWLAWLDLSETELGPSVKLKTFYFWACSSFNWTLKAKLSVINIHSLIMTIYSARSGTESPFQNKMCHWSVNIWFISDTEVVDPNIGLEFVLNTSDIFIGYDHLLFVFQDEETDLRTQAKLTWSHLCVTWPGSLIWYLCVWKSMLKEN